MENLFVIIKITTVSLNTYTYRGRSMISYELQVEHRLRVKLLPLRYR